MASWRIRFHDKWPHLASLYASTHNLDEEGKYPDPMMGQDNVFDPSEPYGAYRYYVQPSTRSEFSIEEPGYMSRPVYKDEESRSSDYTSGDSFRRGSTCRVLLCVSLVVSFIGVVVAAITLAVLLSQSPTPLPEKPGHIDEFESQASIFNREFNENLLDNTTDEFKNLEKEFCKAIEQMFTDAESPVKNAFGGCEVIEFTNGSVQVRYRLKLFSDTFKMDEKITEKLENHFSKKVNEIGPWQNLKFNPKFLKKFLRIEPPTTAAPPTTKITTQPPTTTVETTTKSTKPVVKTSSTPTSTIKQTTIHLVPDTKVTHTEVPETRMKTIESITTTTKLITTMQEEQTTSSFETEETSSAKPILVTEKESIKTTMYDKVTDKHTQTQLPEIQKTTSSTIPDEIITTTAEVKNETRTTGNATGTTELPKVTTDIFDFFLHLNDTFETTEAWTTEVTGQPTTILQITDNPTTSKDFTTTKEDMKQTSTLSRATESITREALTKTTTEAPIVETTTFKEIPKMTQTEVTSSPSTQTMIDEVTQNIIVTVTDKPEETTLEIVQTAEETTTPLIDDVSVRVTKAVVNITESSIDTLPTETRQVEEIDVSTTQTSVVDEGILTEGTTKTDTTINATLPSSVTTSQETNLTTSSAMVEQTKEPTPTKTLADVSSTVKSVESEIVTTQTPLEALKVVVNETTDEALVTETTPILNESSISEKLTTKILTTHSEPSSTLITLTTETTKAETVKESITESIVKPTITEATPDEIDIHTTSTVATADFTTVALPITAKKEISAATKTMDTTQSEEIVITSTQSPIVTTALTEIEKVTEKLIGVSEIVLLNTTYGYNTTDFYYEFETTTSSDALVETSTELPADLISTQEMVRTVLHETSTQSQTEQSLQDTTIQSIITESSVSTEGKDARKTKSEITSERPLLQTDTEGIKVTEQPKTEMAQNDTSISSAVELTTQKESRSSFHSNVTIQDKVEISATTPSELTPSRSREKMKVTTLSANISLKQTTGETPKVDQTVVTTSESPTVESSHEVRVTEILKAVTSSVVGNDTASVGVTTKVLHTEGFTTEKASSAVTEISQTLADTTDTATDLDTEIISELTSTELATEKTPVTTRESPSTDQSTGQPSSMSKTVPESASTKSLPDITTTVVEAHTESVTQSINITDSIPTTAKQTRNDSAANITELEAATTIPSVQETTSFDTVSYILTTETPFNVTDIIYAESTTTEHIQASTEVGTVTEKQNQTTTTPKPAEEAFLDEYGEAAFKESYVPTLVNKTEETSVISISNNTKQSKTTLTVPIATTLSTIETGNVSHTGILNTTNDISDQVTKIINGTESINASTTNEQDVTTDAPVANKSVEESTFGAIDNSTVLPVLNLSTKRNTTQSLTTTVFENGTETKEVNKTETIPVQPLAIDSLKTDAVTTTASTEINVTMESVKPENQSLLLNDTIELVPKNETSVILNETAALNATGASDMTTPLPFETTTASVYNTSDYYDYNDTDYYYATTETPGVTSDTPGITIDTPVTNVTISSISNITSIVRAGDVTIGTNDSVTVSDLTDPITTQSSNVTYEGQTITETITLLPEDVTEFSTNATSSVP